MKNSVFTAVVFDRGATLFKLQPNRVDGCARVLSGTGLNVAPNFIRQANRTAEFAMPHRSSRLRQPGGRECFYDQFRPMPAVLFGVESHFSKHNVLMRTVSGSETCRWRPIWRGTAQVLARRHGDLGLRLLVLANWDHKLGSILHRRGILQRFEGVYDSQQLGPEKPDLQILEHPWRKRGWNRERPSTLATNTSRMWREAVARACFPHS